MIEEWHPEARDELLNSALYYEEQEEGLGEGLTTNVEGAVRCALLNPSAPRVFDEKFRKVKARGFPFAVIYQISADRLQVLAVAHLSRYPGYWRERAKRWES